MSRLATIAAVSGLYDLALGFSLLAGRPLLTQLFDVPLPIPPIHADLNGVFLIAIGTGYILPYRNPEAHRGYLWVMGPLLKGLGAATFILDFLMRQSPPSFLIFAICDGTLALVTLWGLLTTADRIAVAKGVARTPTGQS
jgi:hypothetical protein